MIAKIKEMLLRHEGLRLFPYQDHLGYQTIGIGRCIEKIGITALLVPNNLHDIHYPTK